MIRGTVLVFMCAIVATLALPTKNQNVPAVAEPTKKSLISSDPKISPENASPSIPDLSDMEEIKEEDLREGMMVMVVEEPLDRTPGESMDTSSNVVFRPLFRYREKQAANNRRISNNRRFRRRYYTPRRSYRNSGYYRPYYRPYRSVNSYYNPYRRYSYYGYYG